MTVSYDVFTAAFLNKMTEYRFSGMRVSARQEIVDGFMKRACSRFGSICKYDITGGDDETRTFTLDGITNAELDEIADIVSDGMVLQWMKPYVYAGSNFKQNLVTLDHSYHSQAELVNRITSAYSKCERDFVNRLREYSYRHGDLTDLHI